MTEQFSDLLRQLRRSATNEGTMRAAEPIFFQLLFDEHGGYLRVINRKGEEVQADYRAYSGHDRTLLKTLDGIEERRGFVIDWDKSEDAAERVYLSEFDFLLWQLRGAKNIVDEHLQSIRFAERAEGDVGHILADIQSEMLADGTTERLRARLRLSLDGAELDITHVLTEYAVLVKRVIQVHLGDVV